MTTLPGPGPPSGVVIVTSSKRAASLKLPMPSDLHRRCCRWQTRSRCRPPIREECAAARHLDGVVVVVEEACPCCRGDGVALPVDDLEQLRVRCHMVEHHVVVVVLILIAKDYIVVGSRIVNEIIRAPGLRREMKVTIGSIVDQRILAEPAAGEVGVIRVRIE